jgi:cold shock CspA family protein
MARSQDSFNKKEKEKKRRKRKQDKAEQREQRKLDKLENGPKSFEDMIMYMDENGNFSKTPPDPSKRTKIKAEDIILGIPPKEDIPYDPIRKGEVKFFNTEKGYGFIIDVDTKDSIFVHVNNIAEPITEKDKVTYEVEMGPKGPNAINVKMAVPEPPKPKVRSSEEE